MLVNAEPLCQPTNDLQELHRTHDQSLHPGIIWKKAHISDSISGFATEDKLFLQYRLGDSSADDILSTGQQRGKGISLSVPVYGKVDGFLGCCSSPNTSSALCLEQQINKATYITYE